MKILVVCHRFPFPPSRGGKIRPFNVIAHLSRTHEVTVCSLVRSDEEADEAGGIARWCEAFHPVRVVRWKQALRMIAALASASPSSMGWFRSPWLARRIADELDTGHYDLVFVHCSSVAPMVTACLPRHPALISVLDFGDMDSRKWLGYRRFKRWPVSWGYWLEGLKLAQAERQLAARFTACTATTRAEWQTLESMGTARSTEWFPNGVDFDYFDCVESDIDPMKLCFVGRMDYFPNQQAMFEFCRDVWPQLSRRYPRLTLDIVGADPSQRVRALGDIPGVRVTGSVSDVRPYVRHSLAMVAPLRIARGTQNKLLEAMALGVPVVTTRLAAGGVDAVAGEHLLVADTPAEQIEAIAWLIREPLQRNALAAAARQRMVERHAWSASMQRLDALIDGLAEARDGAGAGVSDGASEGGKHSSTMPLEGHA